MVVSVYKIGLPLSVFLALVHIAVCADVRVYTEPRVIRKGQLFQLIVEARGEHVGEPQLPVVAGINIENSPNIVEDRWSLGSFGKEHVKIRGYKAWSREAGKFRIPPIEVEINGRKEYSEPFQLSILDASEPAPSTPSQYNPAPQISSSALGQQLTWENVLLARSEVSKTSVYLQEPVVLKLKRFEIVHPRVQMRILEETDPPTEGFFSIAMDSSTAATTPSIEQENGLNYRVFSRYRVIYPTRTGTLTIEPWECRALVPIRNFFRFLDQEVTATSEPVLIEVKPLPQGPSTFSGAVGKFDVEAHLENEETSTGVPAVLTVRITGVGNPNAIGEIQIPPSDKYSVGQPNTKTTAIASGDIPSFEKTFQYNITPLVPGELQLPETEFVFFDPELEQYVRQPIGPFKIISKQQQTQERRFANFTGNSHSDGKVQVFAHDIFPIITDIDELKPTSSKWTFQAILFGLPPAIWSVLAFLKINRKRQIENPQRLEFKLAFRKTLKRLEAARYAPDPIEEIYRALLTFLAEKNNMSVVTITRNDAEMLLRGMNIDDVIIEQVTRILGKCERAKYGSATVSRDEIGSLIDGAIAVVKKLDIEFKRIRKVQG